jgi:hypothetical protein
MRMYLAEITHHKIIPAGVGMPGAVRETIGYNGDYMTATGRSDRQFYCCTQTANIKHFE